MTPETEAMKEAKAAPLILAFLEIRDKRRFSNLPYLAEVLTTAEPNGSSESASTTLADAYKDS
jgi:hypothetical protein